MLRSPSCENSLDSHHSLPVLKERTVSQEEGLQLTAGPWADSFSWANPICTCFWVQPSLTTSPTIIFIGPLYSNVEAQERTAELDTETNASVSCVKAIVPILLSREESRGLQIHHLLSAQILLVMQQLPGLFQEHPDWKWAPCEMVARLMNTLATYCWTPTEFTWKNKQTTNCTAWSKCTWNPWSISH